MSTVRELLQAMHQSVASIDQDASVLDAARMLNERHVGALVATRGDRVVGIFTERDVLNRVVAAQRDPATTPVREVMTSPVACCTPDSTRVECRAVMRTRR